MILEVYGRYVGSRMVVQLYRSFSILSSWQFVGHVGRPVVWSIKPDIHRKVSREINVERSPDFHCFPAAHISSGFFSPTEIEKN